MNERPDPIPWIMERAAELLIHDADATVRGALLSAGWEYSIIWGDPFSAYAPAPMGLLGQSPLTATPHTDPFDPPRC